MITIAKRQELPLWFLLSLCIHILILLIPLMGSREDFDALGEIELIEVEAGEGGGQVVVAGSSLPAADAISVPKTRGLPRLAEKIAPRLEDALKSSPTAEVQEEQPRKTTKEEPEPVKPQNKPAPEPLPEGSKGGSGSEVAPKQEAPKPPARTEGGSGSGGGSGAGSTTQSGAGTGSGSGGGGTKGPIAPGPRTITSTKTLSNMVGNPISLSTVVEIRPDGSHRVLEPLPQNSPASSAANREFQKLAGELKSFAYENPYRLRITFTYYPGKWEGRAEFRVLD